MRYIKIIVFYCFSLLSLIISNVYALEKVKFNNSDTFCLNNNWYFKYGTSTEDIHFGSILNLWECISLPHTFNNKDPYQDGNDYYRGIVSYRKSFLLDSESYYNKIFALHFEGVNQEVDVFVNGAFVGSHRGGYTAFNLNIPEGILKLNDSNVITLHVSNALNMAIPPLHIGYTIYGGVYRSIFLIKRNSIFYTANSSKKTIKIVSQVGSSNKKNKYSINFDINLDHQEKSNLTLQIQLLNSHNKKVSDTTLSLWDGAINFNWEINNVELWSPEAPNLYKLIIYPLRNENDIWSEKIGFKHIEISSKNGIYLNGNKYILKGTNRHQDKKDKGAALSDKDHLEDLLLIKNMGCNFLRLAHYPQSNYVLDLADSIGLLIWEEIPVVDYANLDSDFINQSAYMLKEMINQHYNHTSIMMWGIMNEIYLYDKFAKRANKIEDEYYGRSVATMANYLNKVAKNEDKYRFTTLAMHASKDYEKFGIDTITDIASYNMYNGWYNGTVEEFGAQLDKKHSMFPNKCIFISEYGAESDIRINTKKPIRLDNSIQYQQYFHESYWSQIKKRPFLIGTAIWNQFDFGNPGIGGTMSNINHKGMCTWDRKPKDIYYFYKANWNSNSMVHIAANNWLNRIIFKNDSTNVTIYSNSKAVDIYIDRKFFKKIIPNEINKIEFNFLPTKYKTEIIAIAKEKGYLNSDTCIIKTTFLPLSYDTTFESININVGSASQFEDEFGVLWAPDQSYSPQKTYGYTNAKPSFVPLKNKIINTSLTPLYYSFLDNISSYKIDVNDGNYDLKLFFLEPNEKYGGKRVFDIYANGKPLIQDFDLSAQGFCSASSLSFQLEVHSSEGLLLEFKPKIGTPILNGIQLTKNK
jgi:beta-galactosidase